MIDREHLLRSAAAVGVTLSAEQADKLDTYAALLVEWNERMNLTAITDPYDIVVKHLADSLSALAFLPDRPFSLIDVGTGAGFPGIPLAIVRPDIRLTLLDSLNKRLLFLQEVCRVLGVEAATVHARAEEGGRQVAFREQFDVATARAVAQLPVLSEYCLPFVRVGGRFLAMKGPDATAEIASAKGAIHKLGGQVAAVHTLTLPATQNGQCEGRTIVEITKAAHTPAAYPRPGAKMAKFPLK